MASIIVYIERDGTQGIFSVSGNSGGGNGRSSAGAIHMGAGDTVEWQNTGIGLANITGLSYFTNTSNFSVAVNGSVTRTWASGVTAGNVDSITMTKGNSTLLLYLSQEPAAADRTPNAFDVPDVPNATPSALTYSTAQTITGMDANTQCSISGSGSPQLQVGSGPWVTSSTISSGQTINVRLTASNLFSTPLTATLTIGTVTDSITVTTEAEPSGGTGGGTGAYGIQIFDTNGTISVLSPSTRYMTRLTDPESVSVSPNGGSVLITCNMTGLTSSNSTLIVVEYGTADGTVITLESTGFRLTNNNTGTFNNILYAVRF